MIFGILLSVIASASDPITSPVFLRLGFSTVLEFEEAPAQVVLGDQNLFQIEKLNKSIVVRPLVEDASTNMFVYFKNKDAKHFILSASNEAEPTFFRKIAPALVLIPPKPIEKPTPRKVAIGAKLVSSKFDSKHDYLVVDFEIASDSTTKISPSWNQIQLETLNEKIRPTKIWSERREIQKESKVKARAIFSKPNVSNLENANLVIPAANGSVLQIDMKGKLR